MYEGDGSENYSKHEEQRCELKVISISKASHSSVTELPWIGQLNEAQSYET